MSPKQSPEQSPEKILGDLRDKLAQAFTPTLLELNDDSAAHRGHSGSRGGLHLQIKIQSPKLKGIPRLAQHRAIQEVLAPWLASGVVHALSLEIL